MQIDSRRFCAASTFASMKKKADRETTQFLIFTASDTFRGQFEKVGHCYTDIRSLHRAV